LFATHYFELTALPEKHPKSANVHVGVAESGDDIVFLHELQHGPASRSYGVQVARLAGMPHGLIRQARATLEALEAQQTQAQDQIDLFAQLDAGPSPLDALDALEVAGVSAKGAAVLAAGDLAPTLTPAEAQALDLLAAIDPDALTPREALDALYRLKAASAS
jgi:DNA mismatch repair protein MutS